MNPTSAVLFNLIVNALSSFVGALALVRLLLWSLCVGSSRGRLVLLLVPLVKVFWDLGRGIPQQSFLWPSLLGVPQDRGSFMVGIGFSRPAIPMLQLVLGADSHGVRYSQSAADLACRALSKKLSPSWVTAVVVVVIGVAALRVVARLASMAKFALEHRRVLAEAKPVAIPTSSDRRAVVFVSERVDGAPYATGLLRPCIVFPAGMFAELDEAPRRAALLHELAHAERRDPALIVALTLFSELFWFLPGLRGLMRRLFSELELRADARAVEHGARPDALARALASVAERVASAPTSTASLLPGARISVERVERLFDPRDGARAVYRHWLGKVVVFGALVPGILGTVFFGN